jgi:hypothetical protein
MKTLRVRGPESSRPRHTQKSPFLQPCSSKRPSARRRSSPRPRTRQRPCDRHLLDNWLRKAVTLAKVKLEPGGLWRSLRRKWATERKGYPVKDVATAGGGRDEATMLTSTSRWMRQRSSR